MKQRISSYSFSIESRTIDFSSFSGFDVAGLLAIIHQPTGKMLYAAATPSLAAIATGAVITLNATVDLSAMSNSDPLLIFYDNAAGTAKIGRVSLLSGGSDISEGNRLPVDFDRTIVAPAYIDDNSPTGRVRVETMRGNMVAVPLGALRYNSYNVGAATGAAGSATNSMINNDDGTQSGLSISVPASATLGNAVHLKFWIQGSVFGLRRQRDSANGGLSPVSVMIDGVTYGGDDGLLVDPRANAAPLAPQIGLNTVIYATDLDEKYPHYVELMFPCALTGSPRVTYLHGVVLDARAGYVAPPRGVKAAFAPQVLAATTWTSLTTSSSIIVYGPRKIVFYNPSAGAVKVGLRINSTNGQFWGKPLAAGDSAEFDFSGIVYHDVQGWSDTAGTIMQPIHGI